MSSPKKTETEAGLNEVIDAVQHEMLSTPPDTDKFAAYVDQLDKLYKIKTLTKGDRVSKDALIAVAGNLAGIVAILSYERVHVVSSKALGFVLKTRV